MLLICLNAFELELLLIFSPQELCALPGQWHSFAIDTHHIPHGCAQQRAQEAFIQVAVRERYALHQIGLS